MASQSITYGCSEIVAVATTTQSLSFRRSIANFPHNNLKTMARSPVSPGFCKATLKRNPKRLKYSTPRFNKDGGFVYLEVDPCGSDTWKLEPVVKLLQQGAVGAIPTDTVYAFVCDLRSNAAVERLRRIKNIGTSKYTFILPASKELPKQCTRYGTATAKYASRKEVGVRMPDDVICQAILEKLDAPLISTSVKCPKENEWIIDPILIADIYEPEGLDFVVDGGVRVAYPSTVVDATRDPPTILRQGKGPKQDWMVVNEEETLTA